MKSTLLIFSAAIGFVFVVGCSKSPPSAMLGVWSDPTGQTTEITRDKWIAKSDRGQVTLSYRVTKTRGDGVDVALDDEAGNKGTATILIEGSRLKISRADSQWVEWTRKRL